MTFDLQINISGAGSTNSDTPNDTTGERNTRGTFNRALIRGLNFISLPVRPDIPFTAQTLIDRLAATMLTRFDEVRQTFVSYLPGLSDDFTIEGGVGYIVNVTQAKTVAFTGTVWDNVNAAPAFSQPPKVGGQGGQGEIQTGAVWAFVVGGELRSGDFSRSGAIIVRNRRTGEILRAAQDDSDRYAVAFADLSRRSVVEAGDVLDIGVDGIDGRLHYTVTPGDLHRAFARVDIHSAALLPQQNVLLQNYPNPFNPETWIPYHLASAADVQIIIYDATGAWVRRLDLGHRTAGNYQDRRHAAYWDGRDETGELVASGLYVYQLRVADFSATRRMVILK